MTRRARKGAITVEQLGFYGRRAAQQLVEAWRDARKLAAENGLSSLRMLGDLVILNLTRSIGLRPYFQYRLFDPALTLQQKRQYLPDTPWANRRLWSRLTPQRYGCLYANKLIFNRFFGGLGFPVAEILGLYDRTVGYTLGGQALKSSADLQAWLPTVANDGFVFKALEGVRGHSILVFTGPDPQDPAAFLTLAGERYDIEQIVRFTRAISELKQHRPGSNAESFLIEERIRPHPELAAFIGPTLCSVRIQTIIARDGSPRIIAAVFKLQPEPVGVDHLIYGAVGCWVDQESGRLVRGRTRDSLDDTTVIPGTQKSFIGYQLPDWPEVKALALRAAQAFPWARSIGWDIAMSDRGPVLIEGNEEWSPSLIQLPAPHGLMTGEFEELYHSLARR